MVRPNQLPNDLQRALDGGVQSRLPVTFLPLVNEQLHKWEYLFQNERQSLQRLILFVDELTPTESTSLFREVVQLEEKMGVRQCSFLHASKPF